MPSVDCTRTITPDTDRCFKRAALAAWDLAVAGLAPEIPADVYAERRDLWIALWKVIGFGFPDEFPTEIARGRVSA